MEPEWLWQGFRGKVGLSGVSGERDPLAGFLGCGVEAAKPMTTPLPSTQGVPPVGSRQRIRLLAAELIVALSPTYRRCPSFLDLPRYIADANRISELPRPSASPRSLGG
jgi:hypothetical protein